MTVNDILTAFAVKLTELYPDRLVYVDEIPAGADGNFLVRCIEQSHQKGIGRRRVRVYQFEVLYFVAPKDSMAYNDWAETMYWGFEDLAVGQEVVHLSGAAANDTGDMVYHFVVDAQVYNTMAVDRSDEMEGLDQNTEAIT